MELLKKRLSNLLAVKSIVTVILTAVFAYLTCTGGVTAEQFLTVFTVVIAFYFGNNPPDRHPAHPALHQHRSPVSLSNSEGDRGGLHPQRHALQHEHVCT